MTDPDPFAQADPLVIDTAEGSFGKCPCGWDSDTLFPGEQAARQDLDRHLRLAHPDRRFPR